MITVPPSLLAHPADLQRLAGELLALRFDRARLTEALLRVQEAAHGTQDDASQRPADPQAVARRLAGKEWRVDLR